jgi:GGDEF domain-containing protein
MRLRALFDRFRQGWRWRRAGVVVVSTAAAVLAAFFTRDMASAALATGTVIGTCATSLTLLLYLVDRAETVRVERDAGLRRVKQYGERLAIYDRETGLYAYWYFGMRLEEEMERAVRHGQPLAVLLVEAIHGRLPIDEEQLLFDAMAESFRDSDMVAHLGNLRFAVLLMDTDVNGALIAVRRLRERCASDELQFGLASFPEDGEDWPSLLRAAGASADAIAEAQLGAADMRSARRPRVGPTITAA